MELLSYDSHGSIMLPKVVNVMLLRSSNSIISASAVYDSEADEW